MGEPGEDSPAQPDAERPPGPEPAEAGEERRVGGSSAAQAANAALLALTRAARAFTLYDPANKVVRALISDYREKITRALESHGAMSLGVQPYELRLGPETVYLEEDRERSLAFRLFRDGVRKLSFAPSVTWDELLRLLEIFSIRYTGVRQQEDDLVTLLRKASFAGITMTAIEGFVPDEELLEPPLAAEGLGASTARFVAPRQQDMPLPAFTETGPLQYRVVPPQIVDRLRSEETSATVPRAAVGAVGQLLQALPGPEHREAILLFATEIRDFLVVEGQAPALVGLVRMLKQALAYDPTALRACLTAFLDDRTVKAIVAGQSPGLQEVPPALAEVLDLAPGNVLELLLDLLVAEGDGPSAGLLRQLVARAARGSPDALLSRMRDADETLAGFLLGVLHELDPQRATRAAFELARRADAPLQIQILERLAPMPFDPAVGRVYLELLEAPTVEVRARAAGLLAERGGARGFHSLQAHVEKHASETPGDEARAFGCALAQASPRDALNLFETWLHPKAGGLLGRIVRAGAPPALQHTALGGLELIGGPEADALLAHLAEKGDETARRGALAALASRRRRGSGGPTHG